MPEPSPSRPAARDSNDAVETAAPPSGRSGVGVLVLTAPVAEGHLAAARALSEGLAATGEGVLVVQDALDALPRPVRWLLADAYRWQLGAAPWLFDWLFAGLRRSRVLRSLARTALSVAGSRALLRLVRRHRPDVVVSTWPPASLILGCLRLRGKVRVPVCAAITDFAGLELWADRGVDLHLVMHESLVPKVERVAGPGSATLVEPLVSPQFLVPRSSLEARQALGLPTDARVVVVSGGGWAVGDLEGAVATALEIEDAVVVCLAGREAAARVRLTGAFAGEPRVTVLGFTDQMSDLLAAADVLVHSTGGVTCLEALVRGCPIVAYGSPPGHTRLLAEEMEALGLVAYARSSAELRAALAAADARPADFQSGGGDLASAVLAAVPRVVVRLRARLARTTATACALATALFVLLASDATYPVVSEALAFHESSSISSNGGSVALVVRGQRRDLLALAPLARRAHLRASVVVTGSLSAQDVAVLRAAGLDPIPELRARGVLSWFETSRQLEEQRARYSLPESFYYLAPHEGFTFGGYLVARHVGGRPIQIGHTIPLDGGPAGSVHAGEVVAATLEPGVRDAPRLVEAVTRLERAGLRVSSVLALTSRTAP